MKGTLDSSGINMPVSLATGQEMFLITDSGAGRMRFISNINQDKHFLLDSRNSLGKKS